MNKNERKCERNITIVIICWVFIIFTIIVASYCESIINDDIKEHKTTTAIATTATPTKNTKQFTTAKTTTTTRKTTTTAKPKVTTVITTTTTTAEPIWEGPVLNQFDGTVQGPSGVETYYNLDMSGVINIMRNSGYNYNYWVREDGVKMYGDYVMVAADLNIRPRGTLLETSLGTGIVCDTGAFTYNDPYQLDIAVTW